MGLFSFLLITEHTIALDDNGIHNSASPDRAALLTESTNRSNRLDASNISVDYDESMMSQTIHEHFEDRGQRR